MSKKNDTDNDAFRAWFKSELDRVVEQMIKARAVTGVAIDATPMWAVPDRILIAKIWSAAQKSQFIWTISGPAVVTDHVAGSVAVNPKDVANHFALKWQADAERIRRQAENAALTDSARSEMKNLADKLVRDAEALFDMTRQDDIWS
ncbi:MAG: DUF4826 family protein [Xanthomonadales bacterium]